ncbi:MAG TPA: nucleotidyltransferase domain-containing protein [bacterium]|nr:nucleotidyltransferase domain-containing protein [bacterium]
MEFKTKIIRLINESLKGLNPKIFLFGSRSSMKNLDDSDIDIGIDCGRKLSLIELSDIKEKLEESNIIYKIDVVDFNNIDNKFKQIVFENGVIEWQ